MLSVERMDLETEKALPQVYNDFNLHENETVFKLADEYCTHIWDVPSASDICRSFTMDTDDILTPLSSEVLTSDVKEMVTGRRKTWLSSFMIKHLPTNRLRASEDDLSMRYQSLSRNKKKKKKKRVESKARIGLDLNTALARRQIQSRKLVIAPEDVRFKAYIPLREMWLKYISDVINLKNLRNENKHVAAQKIMKADLHGCPIIVQKSKCPSFIGVTGIVIQETRNMFVLVTPDDKLKRIPKGKNIFAIVLKDFIFTIHGNQFKVKPGERVTKKFKSKPSIDL